MQSSPQAVSAEHPEGATGQKQPAHRPRVLVAEDAECTQRIVDVILGKLHVDVDMAEDGHVACDMAARSKAEGRPYDLILMDMQMPKMNGKEATQWLHEHGWKGPIVAVSVRASESDRREFLAAGCDDYIPKPITGTELREVLSRYLKLPPLETPKAAHEQREASAKEGASPKPHGRVLVVEDARCVQMQVGAILRKMCIGVEMADNGQVACDKAMKSKAEGMSYDLILMDMQMPKMNGRQAARWLRDHGWDGPIVAVSIHASEKDHEEFLAAGCNGYVAKPVTEATLREILAPYVVLD
jgi:CheY-like chemotaxis protein